MRPIVAVADASLSTRCGAHGVPIAAAIARSVAAVGLSALFFQDMFGLITFDDGSSRWRRRGRASAAARHLLPGFVSAADGQGRRGRHRDITTTIESHLRKTSLVPVISDFLFADAPRILSELSLLNAVHDVFL